VLHENARIVRMAKVTRIRPELTAFFGCQY